MSIAGIYGEFIGCVSIPTHKQYAPKRMSLWLNYEGYHLTQKQSSSYLPMTLTVLGAIDWDASDTPPGTQSKILGFFVMEEL